MYVDFARLYDSLAYDIPYKAYSQRLAGYLPNRRELKVLEIGVGTGNLTQHIYRPGLAMDLVDQSSAMLALAQAKLADLENLHFYAIDILDFPLDQAYDFVFSNLNVFNYILDPGDLGDLLARIRGALAEDGALCFDINSPYKLEEVLGNQSYIYEHGDVFYTWDNFLDPPYLHYHLDFFVRQGGLYERIQEQMTERIYGLDQVGLLLEKAGFEQMAFYDYDTMGPPLPTSQRVLFVARP